MNKFFQIALVGLVCAAVSCGSDNKNGITNAGVTTFDSLITHLDNEQLVDVRTLEEYQQGHITGAVNYDWNDATFADNVNELDKGKPVLVYCRSGNRSSEAAEYLRTNGFKTVYELDGGLTAWESAGMAIDKTEVIPSTANGVSLAAYNSTIQENAVVLVDFTATWCGPCKMLAPSLHELETEMAGKFILLKVDVDRDREVADYMNIQAMPTLILYKKGEIQWRNEGLVPKEMVAEKITAVQ